MTQHTPGPWTPDEDFHLNGASPIDCIRIWRDGVRLAVVDARPLHAKSEALANARLIAKAPEMLAALCQIEKGEGEFDRDPLKHAFNIIDEHKRIARAMLKEIEGQ